MTQITPGQIAFVVVMAVLLMIILPVLQSRTGKSITEIMFGFKRKSEVRAQSQPQQTKREPRINNGTRGELTAFVSQLLKFASRNKMHLVAPGTITHQGKTARLTALIVAPGGITGVYCLGFGGTISPHSQSAPGDVSRPWKQHINGQDLTFENPLKVCQEQHRIVQGALEEAGISTDLKIVTVFTNPRAKLLSAPSVVFTQKMFLSYLYENKDLKNGSLDAHKTALMLADLAGIKNTKAKKAGK